MRKFLLFISLSLAALSPIGAQESAFTANHQMMALLPGEVKHVSLVDGELYCYASGVMLKAQRSGEQLLGFWADTNFVKLAEDPQYVVRHPVSGNLYFTLLNKKGHSYLYEYRPPTGRKKKGKLKRIKLSGMDIQHPTFTADGTIMIFSSDANGRHSYGGYDLWYSVQERGRWSRPVNLGNRINTQADEVTPSIYRDCLLFSSNGHDNDHGYLNIYSTRLISDKAVGDTVGMLKIGRCRVQRLPNPLNDPEADDSEMVIDTASGYGYWVSTRSDSDSQLYSFSGSLDGVLLWGRITDKFESVQDNVVVTALQNGKPICSTVTDADGTYHLYLQANQYYELTARKDGFFIAIEMVNTAKNDNEFLIAEAKQDIVLDQLPYGQALYYNDLFGPNADIELSERGQEQLQPLIRFLMDNPATAVTLTLYSDLTTDQSFNALLTEHRLQSLEQVLYSVLPSSVRITLNNGCAGTNGCDSASGGSRLLVTLEDEKTE